MIANWVMENNHNIVLLHAVTLLISVLVMGVMYTRTERNALFVSYLALQACLVLWLFGKLVKTVAPSLWLRWAGIVVQYLGMSFLGPALLVFAWRYCLGGLPPRVLLYSLGGVAAALSVLAATNPLHGLLYTTFTMYRDSFGPVWTAIAILTFALAGASCILIAATFRRANGRGRRARLLFLAAILLPCAAFFYYPSITARYDGWRFDITPVFFGFSFLLLGLAVFRYGMLDLVRCALNHVMEGLSDGIVLADPKGRIRWANSRVARHLPALAPLLPGIGTVESALPRTVAGLTHAYARPVLGRGRRRAATVYRLSDRSQLIERTERTRLRCEALDRANHDLAAWIQERRTELLGRYADRLAAELHDVIGHSLTLAVALLDAAARSPEGSAELLGTAERVIRDGMTELEDALGEGDDERGPLLLSDELRALPEIEEARAVAVDLHVEGPEEPVPPRTAEQVRRICEECLANSIRHGRASRVSVVLGFRGSRVELDIRDNGGGCDDIRRGNGLRDIAERVRGLDGSVRFSSGPEKGFRTRLWFPAA
jgi:signal transduction histidine kinase